MNRRTRILWAGALTAGCAAMALVFLPPVLHGDHAGQAAPADRFVVHEWGTFTSFAGSDGVNLEFRPLVTDDLPRFIMNPFSQPGSNPFIKQNYVALQRMETPVTYFYTDTPRVVNVRVDFPKGMLSEWYPVVKHFDAGQPSGDLKHFDSGQPSGDLKHFDSGQQTGERTFRGHAYLDWGPVRLTPPRQFADVRVRGPKGQAVRASLPPVGASDHYGRARETDSAIVETVDATRGSHFEKFLFYRGLGNFELPIKLAALGSDRFEVANSADDASGALLLVRIDDGHVRFTRMDSIGPRSTVEIALPRDESTVDDLAEATAAELRGAGLYPKEALAMVNTWRGSWFGENGTRLLYLVPGKLTDSLLPLSVEPAPQERVRVLVGRLETLTPEDSQRLVEALAGNAAGTRPTAESIEAELASLGRFAEPAIQFAIGQTDDPPTRDRLEKILSEVCAGK